MKNNYLTVSLRIDNKYGEFVFSYPINPFKDTGGWISGEKNYISKIWKIFQKNFTKRTDINDLLKLIDKTKVKFYIEED